MKKALKKKEQVGGDGTRISLNCRPIATNNGRWSPDDWCLEVVEYLDHQLRIQIHECIRQVCCSDVHVRDLPAKPKWHYSYSKIKEHAVAFEPTKGTKSPEIVAVGMFDLACREYEPLWCLCISEQEGLFLQKHSSNIQRAGIFVVKICCLFFFYRARERNNFIICSTNIIS